MVKSIVAVGGAASEGAVAVKSIVAGVEVASEGAVEVKSIVAGDGVAIPLTSTETNAVLPPHTGFRTRYSLAKDWQIRSCTTDERK